ncbi:hypothetical protein DFS33DRAFT_1278494 [Desarmillaria ectypa]|nr:hypothetical protein DFS33DRAFT_1278494 [Desarmillaria ectypa]
MIDPRRGAKARAFELDECISGVHGKIKHETSEYYYLYGPDRVQDCFSGLSLISDDPQKDRQSDRDNVYIENAMIASVGSVAYTFHPPLLFSGARELLNAIFLRPWWLIIIGIFNMVNGDELVIADASEWVILYY